MAKTVPIESPGADSSDLRAAIAALNVPAKELGGGAAAQVAAALGGPPILGVLGNSWVSSHGVNAAGFLARGFGPVTAARLKDRVRTSLNAMVGFAGQSSTSIAPNIDQVLATGARVILVEMLINDVVGGISFATSTANIDAVAKKCQDAGAICVFGTVPPRSDANNTAAVRQGNARLNDYLFDLPYKFRNVHVADVASQLTRRDSGTGLPLNLVLQADGVHPLDLSGELTSQAYFDVLDKILPVVNRGVWQMPVFDRANYPTGYVKDASLPGSAGVPGTGVTGSVASGFGLARSVGSTFTATASKVAGVNGGEYQQVVPGGTGGGLGTEQINFGWTTTALQAGDVVQGLADITATGLTNVKGIYVYVFGTTTGTWYGLLNSGLGGDLSPPSWDRMPRTPEITLPATETIGFNVAIVGKCDGTAPTGTITIKRAGLKVLSAV